MTKTKMEKIEQFLDQQRGKMEWRDACHSAGKAFNAVVYGEDPQAYPTCREDTRYFAKVYYKRGKSLVRPMGENRIFRINYNAYLLLKTKGE